MKIALEISPLTTEHGFRGIGSYTANLQKALLKYDHINSYVFFDKALSLEKDVDLIHYPYFDPFFLSLSLWKKTKTIVTVHDLIPLLFPEHFPAGLRGALKWQIQKLSLFGCAGVITDSFSSKKDIVRLTGISEKKVHVVYLAAGEAFKKINVDKTTKKRLKKQYHLPDKFILYVGDASWNKNIPSLLKAVLRTSVPLVLVGNAFLTKSENNPWNKSLEEAKELAKNQKNIVMTGYVPSEDLVLLYNLATACVVPSFYEGFGLSVLEAMSCGCPVVSSSGGSLGEVVGDAGYLIDPYSIENMAEGINEVFNNLNLQQQLIEKGFKNVDRFSWEKVTLEMVNIYEKYSK